MGPTRHPEGAHRPSRRPKAPSLRRLWLGGVSGVAAVAVGVGVAMLLRGGPSPAATAARASTVPAAVVAMPERAHPAKARVVEEQPDIEPEVAATRAPVPGGPPESLSRQDVLAALAPVKPIVDQCFEGAPGDGTVRITVAASGRVTSAVVTGTFAGTPIGSCIASAAHVAVFRATRRESTTITFRYALRPEEEPR